MKRGTLSREDQYRLAIEVGCCAESVARWWDGLGSAGLRYSLDVAARKLGIEAEDDEETDDDDDDQEN